MNIVPYIQRQIPLRLLQRHINVFIKYGSIQKYSNAILALYYYLRGTAVISTMPLFLKVEISRYCLIDCSYCKSQKSKEFYPFDKFKPLIDAHKDNAFMVQLYEIGEPLHHAQVIDCIRYSHANNYATVISSTLSIQKPDEFWKDLVTSGLDRLIVAIDGNTQSVYQKYRRKGDLELVMYNLRKTLSYKKHIGSKLIVEWQMIDFPWNLCEQEPARRLAYELGCNYFSLIPDCSERNKYEQTGIIRKKNCIWPYVLLLVNAFGNVIPCFKPGCRPGVLGNLNESSFINIWNGENIRSIRDPHQICRRAGCCSCRE